MHFSTFATCLSLLSATGWAQYVLEDDYLAGDFFGQFSFFTGGDPTHGFVEYQDQNTAQNNGLLESSGSNVKLKVDSTNVTPNGRPSVRLTSNKSYGSGLVILDIDHMPGGICGTWPAFWLVGPDWPNQGEIDIIEGVNDQSVNDMTLHTGDGCTIDNNGAFSGSIYTSNCDVNAAGQPANTGCQITTGDTSTYGSGFNAINGGVYATEWTSSAISVYFFPRSSIPGDITSGSPNPSSWGKPLAQFQGGCDISSKFQNQQIVFDTTFCGDWAGSVWGNGACASKAGTCNDYVANNPGDFADAYWSINSLRVYQSGAGGSSSFKAPQPAGDTSAWAPPVSATTLSASTRSAGMTHSVPVPSKSSPYPAGNTTDSANPTGSASGWAPVVTGSGVVGSAPQSVPATSAAAPSSPPESANAPPSQTWDGQPWQSGVWGEHQQADGGFAVGSHVKERLARHLRHHKRHGPGRL